MSRTDTNWLFVFTVIVFFSLCNQKKGKKTKKPELTLYGWRSILAQMASFLSPMAQPRSGGPLQSCHSVFFLDGLSEQAPSRAPFYFEVAPCRVTGFAPRPCSQGQRDQENGSQVSHKRWKHWKLLMLKHLQGKLFFFSQALTAFEKDMP